MASADVIDLLVAPRSAGEKIVRDPHFLVPLVVCFVLTLAANWAMMQPRNALGNRPTTVLDTVESAALQSVGSAVWIFLCFLVIGKFASIRRLGAVAWSFGVNGSIVASGIPALAGAAAMRIAWTAQGSVANNIASILPSLGWLEPQHTIAAGIFAPFDVFLVWQVVLFSQFLTAFGLPAWKRWLLGTLIAVVPPIVFLVWAMWVMSLAHISIY